MNLRKITLQQLQIMNTYICIFLLLFNLLLSLTGINLIDSVMLRIFVVLILIANFFLIRSLVITRYDVIIVLVCGMYYYLFSQSVALNILVLYIIAFYLKNDSIDNIKKMLFRILLIMILLWLVFLIIGLLPDKISTAYGRTRHYLGFKNINQSSLFYFPFLVLLYDKTKKKRIGKLFVICIELVFFYLTDTRSTLFAFLIFVALMWAYGKSERLIHFMNKFIIILILLFTLSFLLSSKILLAFPNIDEMLTYRVSIIAQGVKSFTLINYLFGINELLLDNSFIMFFSAFGVVGFVFLLSQIYKAVNMVTDFEWAYLIMTIAYGFVESTLFIPEAAIAMIFFIILRKKVSEGRIEKPNREESLKYGQYP